MIDNPATSMRKVSSGVSNKIVDLAFTGGILYLAYLSMKSWGIIDPLSSNTNWQPLTPNELKLLNIGK